MGNRRAIGAGVASSLPSLSFNFSSGTVLDSVGGVVPAFTRATTKVGTDWEGKPFVALSGEVVFAGLRRVRNCVPTTSEDFTNGAWVKTTCNITPGIADPQGGTTAYTMTATAGAALLNNGAGSTALGNPCVTSIWIRRRTGVGIITLRAGGTTPIDVTAAVTAVWRRISVAAAATDASFRCAIQLATNGDEVDIWRAMGEDVTGQSNQNPSEYVSVGVLSTPFHGAKVDGVKYFPWLNGNSVTANVVTETTGVAIPKRTGIGIGRVNVNGNTVDYFSTPSAAANQFNGSFDIDWSGTLDSLAIAQYLVAKDESSNRHFALGVNASGQLMAEVYDSAAAWGAFSASSVAVSTIFAAGQLMYVRWKFTWAASGNVLMDYFTSQDGVTWAALGIQRTLVATGNTMGQANGTLTVMGRAFGSNQTVAKGNVFRARIYSGFRDAGGTLVVDFNPANWSTGTTFVGNTGETWTLNGGAKVNKFANGYYPEVANTNLVLQSEDFSTTWTAVGTPTRTGNAKQCGFIKLDLIGDDDATAIEGYTQVVTFTADGVKSRSFFFAQGTSTSSVLRIRDTTAAADRLLAAITWTAGIPTVTMTTGTLIGAFARGNGVWHVEVLTTAVTAANANQVECYPATDAALAVANTGNMYWGGEQAENNATRCSSYIPTTTATVTRNKDDMSLASLGSWFNPAAGSLIASLITGADVSSEIIVSINDASTANRLRVYAGGSAVFLVTTASVAQATVTVAGVPVLSATSIGAAYALNDFIDVKDATLGTPDNSGTVPTVTQMEIGQEVGANQFNGLISSLDYYPQRLPNATLQALTS